MAYFEWGDDLCVGNAQIDDDHRQLVKLVNDLHTATSQGEGRTVVGAILCSLIDYAREHFQHEEQHMERLRYSKLEAHKRQHRELLKTVLAMQARYEAGHITVAAQVSALLRDWLSIHIRREDKACAAELGQKMK